jgi:hypothetical protein
MSQIATTRSDIAKRFAPKVRYKPDSVEIGWVNEE